MEKKWMVFSFKLVLNNKLPCASFIFFSNCFNNVL